MGVGFAGAIAELPADSLVVDMPHQGMQAAGEDDAGKQGAVLAAGIFRQTQLAVQDNRVLLQPQHEGQIQQFHGMRIVLHSTFVLVVAVVMQTYCNIERRQLKMRGRDSLG